ncbi:MAG: hypothetical protein NTV01_02090, partial [Bacteroidia bacterium]|nr:hypothetical protein [Bacteroidia bacterium]
MKKYLLPLLILFAFCQCERNKSADNIDPESGDYLNMVRNFRVFLELEDLPLKDGYIHRNSKDSLQLSELVSNRQLVVLYISINSCMTCVNELFNYIKKDSVSSYLDRVVVLACTPDSRMAYSFIKKFDLRFPVYQLGQNSVLFEKNLDGPFVFLLDRSLKINYVIETSQQPARILEKYFESLP